MSVSVWHGGCELGRGLRVPDVSHRRESRQQMWTLGGAGPEQSLSQPESGRLCQPGFPALQWQPVPGPPAKNPPSSGMAPSRPPSHRAGWARDEDWQEVCLATRVPERAAPSVGSPDSTGILEL